jgi:hypothetical protein
MFELSTEIVKNYINKANQIRIYFYNNKDELLEMYNTKFEYNNDIIPLAITLFEQQPNLIKRKTITMLDGEIILNNYQYKGNIGIPSFYLDIEKFKNTNNIIQNHREIIKTLNTDSMIVMFVNEKHNKQLNQLGIKHFNETEETVFQWQWDHIIIEFIVNITKKKLKIVMMIEMKEEKKLISSKVTSVNELIKKCNKILYQLRIKDGLVE